MSSTSRPSSMPFDPDDGSTQPSIDTLFGNGVPLPFVLIVPGPEARREAWAPHVAIQLAAAAARQGGRVVLADLSLDSPELHAPLGHPNEEGISDVFLFGASLRRIAVPTPGQSFEFAPAGSYMPDTAQVLTSPRWGRLIKELGSTGATLLGYAPAEMDGLAALAARADAAILLATSSEEETVAAALPPGIRVLAVLRPRTAEDDVSLADEPGPETAEPPHHTVFEAVEPDEEDEDVPLAEPARARDDPREALVDALWARRSGAKAAAPQVDPVPGKRVSDADLLAQPVFVTREKPAKHTPWAALAMWVLLGLIVGLAAWYFYITYYKGSVRTTAAIVTPAGSAPAAAPAPAPPPQPPSAPPDSAIPYSVAISAHGDLAGALERVAALRAAESELGFYAAPFVRADKLYYRVDAGPVADSSAAAIIVQQLLDKRIKTGSLPSDIHLANFAFKLGDYDSRDDAEEREREVTSKGIPAYIMEVSGPSGTRHRVYAGAFETRAQAEFMRPMLRGVNIPDSLTRRTGRQAS